MKRMIIAVMALLLSVVFTSAAFAGQQKGQTIYFENLKSVNYGTHGHYWSGDIDDSELLAELKKNHWRKYDDRYGYYDSIAVARYLYDHVYPKGNRYYKDYDRDGQWHFYKDAKGVLHYIYLDPDREYDWHWYKDENGVTQYYVEDKGWK